MPVLEINSSGLQRLRDQRGITTDSALAALVGLHQSNISRVLAGKSAPSNQFIAGIASAFGYESFPVVFTVKEDDQ